MNNIEENYQSWIAILETILYLEYRIKLYPMVRLLSWSLGNMEYPFITITYSYTLTQSVLIFNFHFCIGIFNLFLYVVACSHKSEGRHL